MWPREVAAKAVNELADHGVVVLGLDLRSDDDGATPNGLATEIPWSAYDGDDVEGGREAALAALTSPRLVDFDGYRWVLVTW